MKDLITNKGLLIGAGTGAGIGLALAWLTGANKAGTIIALATLGGFVGYAKGETASSFSGGGIRFAPQSPPVNN